LLIILQTYNDYTWLAPYGYVIVLTGFAFYFFRLFENFYGNYFNKPLFRHYLVYKKLSESQIAILKEDFSFYNLLSKKYQCQFQHRVVSFIADKEYVAREDFIITERIKVLIAATGCMLSFGRKNYDYGLIEYILIYPEEFYSNINNAYHKGEFNPRGKALVLSWKDFEIGYDISNDNRNLGIHEFMHAMQLEAKQGSDGDSGRFEKQFQNILKQLAKPEIKDKLIATRYFREYAFTNQYEFMAVMTEYFFESPQEFKKLFPELYGYTKKVLNFNFVNY